MSRPVSSDLGRINPPPNLRSFRDPQQATNYNTGAQFNCVHFFSLHRSRRSDPIAPIVRTFFCNFSGDRSMCHPIESRSNAVAGLHGSDSGRRGKKAVFPSPSPNQICFSSSRSGELPCVLCPPSTDRPDGVWSRSDDVGLLCADRSCRPDVLRSRCDNQEASLSKKLQRRASDDCAGLLATLLSSDIECGFEHARTG